MKKLPLLAFVATVVAVLAVAGFAFTKISPKKEKPSNVEVLSTTTDSKPVETSFTRRAYYAYDPAKLANAETGKVVLYFHSDTNIDCQHANNNFIGGDSPVELTLLKTSFTAQMSLKKKYHVDSPLTYVQVDKDGSEIKKWEGSMTFEDVMAQVE